MEESSGAPFNFALATLMRINSIIELIGRVNLMGEERSQFIKLDLIKQLFIQSIPLINKQETKDALKKKIDDLKLPEPKKIFDLNGTFVRYEVTFDSKAEAALDKLEVDIQEALQAEGAYFMPTRSDPRYSWKQT